MSQGTRRSASLDEELLFTAVPIVEGARRTGAVRVTQSVDAVRAEVRRDTLALIGLGVAALALGLLVAWMLAGYLSRPLRGLTAAARRVEAGDLDARAQEGGAREHREVAHAFNDMTERVGQSMAAQRDFVANAAHQLRTPLTGLRLRLEAAGLKADDRRAPPRPRRRRARGRAAGAHGDRPPDARAGGPAPAAPAPLALSAAGEAAVQRWRGVAEERDLGARAPRPQRRRPRAGLRRGRRGRAGQPGRERPRPHRAGATVAIELDAAGGDGRLAVLDAGPGLGPGEEERVFERFFRGSSGRRAPAAAAWG